jgi:hypothetical protein
MAIGWQRPFELAAIFMIGDGFLGIALPAPHVALWRSGTPFLNDLVRPFGGRPRARQVYGILQVVAGLALAFTLTATPAPVVRHVTSASDWRRRRMSENAG